MFDDIEVRILGYLPNNNPLKTVWGSLQDYNIDFEKDGYNYKCTKMLFVDCIEPLLIENFYLGIDGNVYRIINEEKYSDHMEIYLFLMDYVNIKLNDADKKAIILSDSQSKDYFSDQLIFTDFVINTGDIIQYGTFKYIILNQVTKENNCEFYRGIIRKIQLSIKIYINNVLREFPCLIEAAAQTIVDGKLISIPDGNIKVTISDNEIAKKITYDNCFIKMGSKWKVVGFTSEHLGLKYLYCEKIQFSESDDKDNEIADYHTVEVIDTTTNTIQITGASKLVINTQQTYNATVLVNGVADTSKLVTWSILDLNDNVTSNLMVTPSGNTCIVKALEVTGYYKLKATYGAVTQTFNIQVNKYNF